MISTLKKITSHLHEEKIHRSIHQEKSIQINSKIHKSTAKHTGQLQMKSTLITDRRKNIYKNLNKLYDDIETITICEKLGKIYYKTKTL